MQEPKENFSSILIKQQIILKIQQARNFFLEYNFNFNLKQSEYILQAIIPNACACSLRYSSVGTYLHPTGFVFIAGLRIGAHLAHTEGVVICGLLCRPFRKSGQYHFWLFSLSFLNFPNRCHINICGYIITKKTSNNLISFLYSTSGALLYWRFGYHRAIIWLSPCRLQSWKNSVVLHLYQSRSYEVTQHLQLTGAGIAMRPRFGEYCGTRGSGGGEADYWNILGTPNTAQVFPDNDLSLNSRR